MSITQVGPKKFRVQCYDAVTRRNVSISKVLGGSSYRTSKKEAKHAREQARQLLAKGGLDGPTLAAFAYRWTTDPLWARPKGSTDLQNHWAVREFVDMYGHLPIRRVTHEHVSQYLAGGKRSHRVQALRTMFSDAMSPQAGRLIDSNPFARLKVARPKAVEAHPPTEAQVWQIIRAAREQAGPSFSAWLQVACFTGLRPGELDALRWEHVDLAGETILVLEQYNARTRGRTAPKNGKTRDAILTPHARDALMTVPRVGPYCFTAPRGGHYTPAARRAPWARVREQTGWDKSLYVATRHFAGWYMVNVLNLDSEDVAFALGHEDGGEQVRRTYGHRDRRRGLERVRAAYASVRPLELAKETA